MTATKRKKKSARERGYLPIQEVAAGLRSLAAQLVFMVEGYPSRMGHKAVVKGVRQRSNGNFVVEFDGWHPPEKQIDDGSDDIS